MSARIDPAARADRSISLALHEYAAAAVRNDRVDPVTTELVRLRCARHHACGT